MEDRIITYGGQAVIEGVMMRGQKAYAIAMRAPDGTIAIHTEKLAKVYRSRITTIPPTASPWKATPCGLPPRSAWSP